MPDDGCQTRRRRASHRRQRDALRHRPLGASRTTSSIGTSSSRQILGADSGWQPVPLADLITAAAVKKEETREMKTVEELMYLLLVSTGKNSDAVEVAGKDVLSTSSTVTTGLVSHKYGEKAVEATNEGLGAAGHAIGTAWAVFKIRQALNPKSVLKPTSLAKSSIKAGAAELRAKSSKSK